jgi:hypothetical protein
LIENGSRYGHKMRNHLYIPHNNWPASLVHITNIHSATLCPQNKKNYSRNVLGKYFDISNAKSPKAFHTKYLNVSIKFCT